MPRVAACLALLVALLLAACGAPDSDEPPTPPPPPPAAAPFDLAAFEQAMTGPEAAARTAALDALLAAPEPPVGAIGRLAAALSDENRWVRDRAARALERYGPAATPAIPALVAALRDPDGFVRWRSAKALAAMGPAGAPAEEELARMAGSKSETELGRHWSAVALERIRGE